MSRIGQKPVSLPSGVTATAAPGAVTVKGPKGELRLDLPRGIAAAVEGGAVVVKRERETRECKSAHGTIRSLIANMMVGVTKGYTRQLEIEGVGFKAAVQGQKLEMSLGFAAPVVYMIPAGIKIEAEGGTKLTISGADKQKIGEVAAHVRSFYPVEPYKGKGLRYKDERVRRKVGKTVA